MAPRVKQPKTVRAIVQKFCDDASTMMNSIDDMEKVAKNNKELCRRLSLVRDKIANASKCLNDNVTPILARANEIVE